MERIRPTAVLSFSFYTKNFCGMILMLIAAILFLFIAITSGFLVTKLLKRTNSSSIHLFETLLAGIAGITAYLNVLSLFIHVNYFTLIPLLIAGIYTCFRYRLLPTIFVALRERIAHLLKGWNALISVSFLIVLIGFIFVPPYNTDSGGYHILAIRWNEQLAIVPGMANIFPQFGFNSSFLVLSAPFALTNVFGQSLYPINGVLITSFFFWLLSKSFRFADGRKPALWLLLLFFLRQFPINLASPSPDALFMIAVLFIFFMILEESAYAWNSGNWKMIMFIAIFCVVIKISTIPVLLLALVPLFVYKTNAKQRLRWAMFLVVTSCIIIIPFLVRNVIITGYLLYPVPVANVFSFDWKVPFEQLIAERIHVANAPRLISADWQMVQNLPFYEKVILWLPRLWGENRVNALLVYCALASPLGALLFFKKKINNSRLYIAGWSIGYIGVWFWIYGSPDVRFGFPFLILTIIIPMFALLQSWPLSLMHVFSKPIAAIAICIICIYYLSIAVNMLAPYRITEWVYKPLVCPEYLRNNDLSTFKYKMLSNGVKLYIHDAKHHCINAPLPCSAAGNYHVLPRGNTIQQGFKPVP